jgi:hypothetical protein
MATPLAAGTEPHWRAVPSLLLHHCARLVCCLLACPTLPNIRLYSLPVFIVRCFRPTGSGRTVRDVTVDHDSCRATLIRRNRRRVQGCAVCRRSRQLRRTCWSGMDGSCEHGTSRPAPPRLRSALADRTAPAVIRMWALQMLGTEPGGCARRRLNLRFTGSNLVRLRRERAMTLVVFRCRMSVGSSGRLPSVRRRRIGVLV